MRVLQVIDSLATGGAEMLLAKLHALFLEREIECEYYLLRSEDTELERALLSQGARLYCPLKVSVYSPRHIFALRRHLRAHRYDVIHVHLFPAQLWAAMAAAMAGVTGMLVTTEHNTTNRRRRIWFRALDRWMYAHYQRIACISTATLELLAAWAPQVAERMVVCRNGIDVAEFAAAVPLGKEAAFALAAEVPVVLAVGRLEEQKDHATLLRAISALPGVQVAIAGAGPLLEKLRLLAEELGMAQRVHFLGRRADVKRLLKSADIYAQSSRWEGMSLAALEAMASGAPMVVSDLPGTDEVVGDAALRFPPGEHARLAECIRTLLADKALRQRLSRAAQERAKEFSITETRDGYARLYREMAARAGKRSLPHTL